MSDLYFLSLSSKISFIDGPEFSSVEGAFGGFGDFVIVAELAIDRMPGGGAVGVFVFGIYSHSGTLPKFAGQRDLEGNVPMQTLRT